MRILRRWFPRLLIVSIALSLVNLAIYSGRSASALREDLVHALPAVMVVFTLAGAIVLALFSNAVLSLNQESFLQARRVKKMAWRAYDALIAVDDETARQIAHQYVSEVLETNLDDLRDSIFDWEGLGSLVHDLMDDHHMLVTRYLIPLEDEMNQMGLIFIRRVLTDLHRRLLWGTLGLVAVAIGVLVLDPMLPGTPYVDVPFANLVAIVLAYTPIQLLVATAYLDQEAREHGYETVEQDVETSHIDPT